MERGEQDKMEGAAERGKGSEVGKEKGKGKKKMGKKGKKGKKGACTASLSGRNTRAVEGTNDAAFMSKCSAAAMGYVEDPELLSLIKKPARRAPIINRGYYIRAKALDTFLRFALQQHSGPVQILALGAGFDMTYFRLRSQGLLDETTTYFELDLPTVVQNKLLLLSMTDHLQDDRPEHESYTPDPAAVAALREAMNKSKRSKGKAQQAETQQQTQETKAGDAQGDAAAPGDDGVDMWGNGRLLQAYRVVGADLRDLHIVEARLAAAGLRPDIPCIAISECVLTYVPPKHSNPLLRWLASFFQDVVVADYEQVFPDDAFGAVMQRHFTNIGSPLRCVTAYPTPSSQVLRFRRAGFQRAVAPTMWSFYNTMLKQEERARVARLEPFDEYEEWHEKAHHYTIAIAGKGCFHRTPQDFCTQHLRSAPSIASHVTREAFTLLPPPPPSPPSPLSSSPLAAAEAELRYGHCGAVCGDAIVLFGGVGSTAHRRLHSAALVRGSSASPLPSAGAVPSPRVHAQLVTVQGSWLVLFGGRASPLRPCSDISIARLHSSSPVGGGGGAMLHWRRGCVGDDGTVQTANMNSTSPNSGGGFADDEGEAAAAAAAAPPPVWRHTMVAVDASRALVIGGRILEDNGVLGDAYVLHVPDLAATATALERVGSNGADSGGIEEDENHVRGFTWSRHTAEGVQRYAHAACLLPRQHRHDTSSSSSSSSGGGGADGSDSEGQAEDPTTLHHHHHHQHQQHQQHAGNRAVIAVYGGLDANEKGLGSYVEVIVSTPRGDPSTRAASTTVSSSAVAFAPQLPPRFGHKMAWCRPRECIVVCGGCGPSPLAPHERFMLLHPQHRTWQYVDVSGSLSSWFRSSLMLNHTCFCSSNGDVVVAMGGGNCFSFGTHFDQRVLRFRPQTAAAVVPVAPPSSSSPPSSSLAVSFADAVDPSCPPPFNHFVQGFDASSVTAAAFMNDIAPRRLPALFSGCDFGLASEWTAETLATACADKEASAHVATTTHLNFLTRNFRFEVMPMPELIRRVFADTPRASSTSESELLYLRTMGANFRKDVADIEKTHPTLFKQFSLPSCFPPEILGERKFSTALRLSSKGVQLWTHYDIMDNVLFNVIGRKRVILFPPSQVDNMYVDGSTSAVVDVEAPNVAAFPRFRNALRHAIVLTLEPGDALFIPAMWFHNVRALTPCVSVNAFFHHLPRHRYQRKDLYGNKDLPEASRALAKAEAAVKELEGLVGPEEGAYRDFYLRKLRVRINERLDAQGRH